MLNIEVKVLDDDNYDIKEAYNIDEELISVKR